MFADRVVGRRGFPLESIAARICKEARGRVATNMFVKNIDLGVPNAADNRRLELWLMDSLFGGVQLAVDTNIGVCSEWRSASGTGWFLQAHS